MTELEPTVAAAVPTAEGSAQTAAIHGPITEPEGNMPLLRDLQQLLYDQHKDQAFGHDDFLTAGARVFGQPLRTNGRLHLKLKLGDGVVYETLDRQVCVHGAIQTHGKYRVILTSEQQDAAAAAAEEAEAQRAAVRQRKAAKEEAQNQALKQFADVPEPGTDLNSPPELRMERRRLELRVSDRNLMISVQDVSNMKCTEGLACEHFAQPVQDHHETYFRVFVKFEHPTKKTPTQAFKLLGDATGMIVLPEHEAAAARATAKAEAETEYKRVPGVTLQQCLEHTFYRILPGYAYAVPEDSTFYDLAESVQHQIGEFRTARDRDMAKRRSLTTDAQGKELTQRVWKNRVVELTDTVAELQQTIKRQKVEFEALSELQDSDTVAGLKQIIASLECQNKRQRAELESVDELRDWELQEDGTMVKLNRTDEEELELMLEQQRAAEVLEEEYWDFL
jgi:hypothetical protein